MSRHPTPNTASRALARNSNHSVMMNNQTKGLLLIGLAIMLLYAGSYFRETLPLQNKILVAADMPKGSGFEDAMVLVIRHDRLGAFGLIVNRDDGVGGPVKPENTYILHTTDVMLNGSQPLQGGILAFTDDTNDMDAVKVKPRWYLVLKGYTGWGSRQLDREVAKGMWRVHNFDQAMIEAR